MKNPEGLGNVSLRIDVPEVTVDVGVLLEKTHQFVPGLKPDNFRVYEDGVEQKVIGFKRVEAPITALLLCEFAANSYYFIYDMRNAAWAFAQQLRPQDYVAMMTFDMHTQIVTDFTQDKRQILQGINSLQIPRLPGNQRLRRACTRHSTGSDRVEGRKYIILIASGRDTFSKLTFDKIDEEGQGLAGHHHLYRLHRRHDARDDRGPRRHERLHARHGLSAGRQRDEDLRQPHRRAELLSALRGRDARHLSEHQPDDPLQVRAGVPA